MLHVTFFTFLKYLNCYLIDSCARLELGITLQNSYTVFKFQLFAQSFPGSQLCFLAYLQSSSIISSKDQKIEPEIYNIIYDGQNYVVRDVQRY